MAFLSVMMFAGGAQAATYSFGTPSTIAGSLTPLASSCSSVGNCAVVGYLPAINTYVLEAQDEVAGVWQAPVALTLPGGASPAGEGGVAGVSCPADGDCVAVGGATTNHAYGPGGAFTDAYESPVVWTESQGSWGGGTLASLPGDAAPPGAIDGGADQGGDYNSVACASTSFCVATGTYENSSQQNEALVSSGMLLSSQPEPSLGYPLAAGCTVGTTTCLIGGEVPFVTGGPDLAYVATDSDGTIGDPVNLTPGYTNAPGTSVVKIDCPDGTCTVAGYYNKTTGVPQTVFTDQQASDGSWKGAVYEPSPAGGYTDALALSCPSIGNCVLVGAYDDSSTQTHEYAMEATESNGTFGPAMQETTPSGGSDFDVTYAAGVGCGTVECTVVGNDSAGMWAANVVVSTTTVCTGVVVSTPENTAITISIKCPPGTGQGFTYAITSGPGHGTLGAINQSTATVTYAPAAGYTGSDSFQFQLTGPDGTSLPATVAITVTSPNTGGSGSGGSGSGSGGSGSGGSGSGSGNSGSGSSGSGSGGSSSGTGGSGSISPSSSSNTTGSGSSGAGTAGTPTVTGQGVSVNVGCAGSSGSSCVINAALTASVSSNLSHALTMRAGKVSNRVMTLGKLTVVLHAGQHRTLTIKLDATGKRLLATLERLTATVTVSQTSGGHTKLLKRRTITLRRA